MKRVVRRSGEASRNCASAPSSFPGRSDVVRYMECQKNHAAAIGGYAVDGCREFMASSAEEGSPEAFLCAACSCHRSFHRRHDANAAAAECATSPPNSSSYC